MLLLAATRVLDDRAGQPAALAAERLEQNAVVYSEPQDTWDFSGARDFEFAVDVRTRQPTL